LTSLIRHSRFAAVLFACMSVGLHWSALQVAGGVGGIAVEFSRAPLLLRSTKNPLGWLSRFFSDQFIS
jgi:hypothetical protein